MKKMLTWVYQLEKQLNILKTEHNIHYRITIQKDIKQGLYLPLVTIISHGITQCYLFHQEFFRCIDYRHIVDVHYKISNLLEPGAYIQGVTNVKQFQILVKHSSG